MFGSPEAVARTLMEFLRAAEAEQVAILAYCFMPNHLDMLVAGSRDDSGLHSFVQVAKERSGRTHATVYGTRLWQEGHHERVLRPSEDARAVARCILENPVRAGLVVTPGAYPYLGSAVWSVGELLGRPSR